MERDPLLATRGQSRVGKGPSQAFPKALMLQLVVLHCVVFNVITYFFAFEYHHWPGRTDSVLPREGGITAVEISWLYIAILVLVLGCTWNVLESSRGTSDQQETMRRAHLSGGLCILAAVMGVLYGLHIYHEHFMPYEAYSSRGEYTNVLPSEPAAAHADAGKIEFANNAMVDAAKAVGYKHGDVYCVAPIMDNTQSSRVEYWAVGMNCCKQRADFQCDDADDASAKGGVVLLDSNALFPTRRDKYEKAVKMAEAAFDVVSSPAPIFVRWVADPAAMQEQYLQDGIGALIVGSAVDLVFALLLGYICAFQSKR